jgi:hypothetical protein
MKRNPLPPDPEEMNDKRAQWAANAVNTFLKVCKTDREDALADLLCDLRHYADRQGYDWTRDLRRAEMNYQAETEDIPTQEDFDDA